tara:strand:- start:1536 stop:1724 length:189 start_codon:yes stop_codon:yes gene_type:complete
MNNEKRIEIAVNMLEEMILLAEQEDKKHKAESLAKGQGEQSLGESWTLHHLRALKSLLEKGE